MTDEVIKRTDQVYKRLRFSALKQSRGDGKALPVTSADDDHPAMEGGGEIDITMKELLEGNFDDVDEKMIAELEREDALRFVVPSPDAGGLQAALAGAGVKVCC